LYPSWDELRTGAALTQTRADPDTAMTVPARRGRREEVQNPNRFSGHSAGADNPDQERIAQRAGPFTHQAGAGRRDVGASRTDPVTS
jgi:hypothetical protein